MARASEWIQRIKDVESEFRVVEFATERLTEEVTRDPTILPDPARPRDVGIAAEHLEGTYLVRLFAEFESSLRSYWSTRRSTQPSCRDLIESMAGRFGSPGPLTGRVHSVREYRNHLVHEREEVIVRVPLAVARRTLCTFIARLPIRW
jgi:hypothetical protein